MQVSWRQISVNKNLIQSMSVNTSQKQSVGQENVVSLCCEMIEVLH